MAARSRARPVRRRLPARRPHPAIPDFLLCPLRGPEENHMLKRSMLLLMAMLLGSACAMPAFAAEQTPQQIVQSIADQLGTAIQGHQAELLQHPDGVIKINDGIVLPHFDTDYASLLVLGRHAREATPAQRVAFAQ